MAIAYSKTGVSHAASNTTGSVSESSFSWVHPEDVGNPIAVMIAANSATQDAQGRFTGPTISSVTIGGATGDFVARAADYAGEPGLAEVWWKRVPGGSSLGNPSRDWAAFDTGMTSGGALRTVAGANGYFMMGGLGGFMRYTTDPTITSAWSTPTHPFGSQGIYMIRYLNGYWIAVGGIEGSGTPTIAYKAGTDPSGTWTAATLNTTGLTTHALQDVAYTNGYWVAVGTAGICYTKTGADPTGTWTRRTDIASPNGNAYYNGIDGDGTYFIAVSSGGDIRRCTDPTNNSWTSLGMAAGSSSFVMRRIRYLNGRWSIVGDGANYATSANATTNFTQVTGFTTAAGSTTQFHGIDSDGTYLCAMGWNQRMVYTTDLTGLTGWTLNNFINLTSQTSYGIAYDSTSKEWIVGAPSGSQTNVISIVMGNRWPVITVNRPNTTVPFWGVSSSVTGSGRIVLTWSGSYVDDQTLAETSVIDYTYSGEPALAFAIINSGLAGVVDNPASPGANNLSRGANSTALASIDFGTRVAMAVRTTTPTVGTIPIGFSSTTSDDVAATFFFFSDTLHKGWGVPT